MFSRVVVLALRTLLAPAAQAAARQDGPGAEEEGSAAAGEMDPREMALMSAYDKAKEKQGGGGQSKKKRASVEEDEGGSAVVPTTEEVPLDTDAAQDVLFGLLLDVVRGYQTHLPQVMLESRVDVWKFLSPPVGFPPTCYSGQVSWDASCGCGKTLRPPVL